jgi:uroporphyrin-III C-methyltransferase
MSGSSAGRPGRVWLVGAGPGDPDLITVRGRRLLETAGVVLHDRLVSPAMLELIPVGTLRLDVGKLGYKRSMSQERINTLLIGFANAGYDVVRLKGGDPFVFGRGGEEVIALREAGIQVEVVPGISAGVAGPAYAGIPVTHRGVARSVAFVTANTAKEGTPDAVDWNGLATVDTLVVFMAGAAARRTATSLIAAGRAPQTPAALIVDATLPEQVVLHTDLAELSSAVPDLPAERPCLLVIGEVVALASLIGAQVAAPAIPVAASGSGVPRTPQSEPAIRAERGSPARR